MTWREAREAKGWTQEEVMFFWRTSALADVIKKDVSTGKYTRLDAADPSRPTPGIGPVAKYELAKLLDVDLRDVDPDAADEYDAIVETVTTRGGSSSTWETASPGVTSVAA